MSDQLPAPIRAAFQALDRAGVAAVVLRGFLPVSELATATDIDVFILPDDRDRAARALGEARWLPRRVQTGRYPHRFFDNFDIEGRICTTVDVVHDLAYGPRLLTLRSARRVLDHRGLEEGVPVPDPWVALFTLGLHVLLDKGALSPASQARGTALWARCAGRSARPLAEAFGIPARALAERIGPWLAGGGDALEDLERTARALPCLTPHPGRAFLDRRRVAWRVRRLRPFRVAVVGMDGSGKSTVIARATQTPSSLPVGTAYLGYNQFTTRTFQWLLARKAYWTTRRGDRSIRARLFDQLRALWWPVELYARMRRAEWWRAVVVYDRFPFPRYERDGNPTSLLGRVMFLYERLWTALLPGPDALILCDGDPRVIWNRKREYSFEVYQAARARLGRLYEDFRGEKRILRTDGALAETIAAVPEALRTSTGLRARVVGSGR